jgi:hypothetical protein
VKDQRLRSTCSSGRASSLYAAYLRCYEPIGSQ